MSEEVDLGLTLEAIREFEEKLRLAIEDRYASEREDIKKQLIEDRPLLKQIDLQRFFDTYKTSNIYPLDRLSHVVSFLMDIKIQMYFLEIDTSLYNRLIHTPYQDVDFKKDPKLLLTHLSLDQSMIVKSRILWERIMNFVYYLETGKRLENGVSKRQSKKQIFWKAVNEKFPNWCFLKDYEDFIEGFDNQLRTPEVHKCSTLRVRFMENSVPDPDILLTLLNISMNIWQNVFSIVKGEEPRSKFWTIGLDKVITPYE
ncbi:MAG: hypothetical protein ACOX50_05200 [Patescibacteria group bacterium]|jgi:hypothetical protein